MKIFKFGGASVKDSEGVKNVARIVKSYGKGKTSIVISAMGKTTNALEKLVAEWFNKQDFTSTFNEIRQFHLQIAGELFLPQHQVFEKIEAQFQKLNERLSHTPSENYDFEYDQIVSFGEVVSTILVSEYLNETGLETIWLDARELIRTDHCYREGRVNWEKTAQLLLKKLTEAGKPRLMIIQGFLGHTPERNVTTLGREGSDFTAAILAYVLNAQSVTIWKDVPGMLNADPKYFKDTVKLKQISYREAIELAFYGASVIHPKTIKPLQNKEIPLYVKSFMHPEEEGTLIHSATFSDSLVPSYIFKVSQILISLTPRDFSFIDEENLSSIFGDFASHRVHINLMQNSAINFSACVDDIRERVDPLIEKLNHDFSVLYNRECELVTIRHYDQKTLSRLLVGKSVLIEQRSRNTARLVLKEG